MITDFVYCGIAKVKIDRIKKRIVIPRRMYVPNINFQEENVSMLYSPVMDDTKSPMLVAYLVPQSDVSNLKQYLDQKLVNLFGLDEHIAGLRSVSSERGVCRFTLPLEIMTFLDIKNDGYLILSGKVGHLQIQERKQYELANGTEYKKHLLDLHN